MSSRIIRDSVLDSTRYHAVEKVARLAYLEMLLCADDFGLMPVSEIYLQRHCTAFSGLASPAIDTILGALMDQDLLRLYVAPSGVRYAYIPRFGNQPRATKSKWPLPPQTPAFEDLHILLAGGAGRRIWFYVYKITHTPSGKYYIGSRSSTKEPAADPYFGSGAACKWLASHRSSCTKTVHSEHETIDAARATESLLIAEMAHDPLCLNISGAGPNLKIQGLSGFLHSGFQQKQSDVPETETETETEKKKGTGTAGGSGGAKAAPRPAPDQGNPDADRVLVVKDLVADGVPAQVAADWLKVRKAKKAPLTQTAWAGVKAEAVKASMTPAEAVKYAAESGWQGFRASWVMRDRVAHGVPGAAPASKQAAIEAENQRVAAEWAAKGST